MATPRHVKEICPNCGSLYIRKYGKVQLKEKVFQKYRCMNCKYVWQEHVAGSMPQKIFELILEMLRAFIRDIDRGKSINDAGWLPLNDENIRNLLKVSFCEVDYENMSGRVNPYGKLPEDVLLTEEGHIFSEYIKSLNVAKEIQRICKNKEEYSITITTGLKFMFQKARYTFWEKKEAEGSIPEEIRSAILNPQWARATESFANLLAEDLSKTTLGADEPMDFRRNVARKAHDDFGLNRVFDNERVKAQWRKIIGYFSEHLEIVEFLGLIWFAIKKADENGIDHVGARILILEETIKAVACKRHMDERSLRERLKDLGEDLDKLTEGELWGVNWSDVFTIPW